MHRLFLLTLLLPVLAAAPVAAQPNFNGGDLVSLNGHGFDPGEPLYVGFVFGNSGFTAAPPSVVGVYLSTDDYISDDDILLAEVPLAGIGVQSWRSGGVTVPTPDVPRGGYSLLAVADHENEIAETNESDNVNYGDITIRPAVGGPDLLISTGELDEEEVAPGGRISVEYVIANRGRADVGDFEVGYYLRPINAPPSEWIFLERETLGGLDAGEDEDEFEEMTVPASTVPGLYAVLVWADDRNAVAESVETNNILGVGLLTVTGTPPPPDFAVTASASPSTVGPGGTFTLSASVQNNTDAAAPFDAWLSGLTANGSFKLQLDSGVLPTGADVSRSYQLRVPAGTGPGAYGVSLRVGTYPAETLGSDVFVVTVPGARASGSEALAGRAFGGEAFAVEAVGPLGEGLFAADASALTSEGTALMAWPNPASARVTLGYTLAKPSEVRLAVYDVLGREVAVVAEGARAAGAHEVAFDASALPAGVYVVRLAAGSTASTRRLTVVR